MTASQSGVSELRGFSRGKKGKEDGILLCAVVLETLKSHEGVVSRGHPRPCPPLGHPIPNSAFAETAHIDDQFPGASWMLLTSLLPKLQTVLSCWEGFSPFYFFGPLPTLHML